MEGWNSNEKIYFSEIRVGKVLTTVKNNTKYGCHFIGKHFWGVLVVGYWLDCTILPTTNNRQPTTNNPIPSESEKKAVCNIIAFRLQKLCFYNVITKLLQCNNYAFVFDYLFARALVVCVVYTFNKITPPSPIKTGVERFLASMYWNCCGRYRRECVAHWQNSYQ